MKKHLDLAGVADGFLCHSGKHSGNYEYERHAEGGLVFVRPGVQLGGGRARETVHGEAVGGAKQARHDLRAEK